MKFLIIGSGIAGTAIADTILKEKPDAEITILEAGGKIKLKDFGLYQSYLVSNKLPNDRNFIYDSVADLPYPEKDRHGENDNFNEQKITLTGSRLFVYGGSTTHWGGWCFRMKPEDFELGKKGKNINWPISYNDLEPYYCRAEHFIGVSGDFTSDQDINSTKAYPFRAFPFTREDGLIIQGFTTNGISHAHLPIARNGVSDTYSKHAPCQTTGTCKYCPFGARFAAANKLDDMCGQSYHPNLWIITHAVVQRIIKANDKTVSGLEYLDKVSGKLVVLSADQVIIAAGAIESTKLLIDSRITDNDNLGRHYVTHPYFSFSCTIPKTEIDYQPQMGFPTLVSRYFDTEHEQAKGKFILIHPHDSPKINLADEMIKGRSKAEIKKRLSNEVTFRLQGMVEIFSDPANTVRSGTTKTRFGLQGTEINYKADTGFLQRLKEIETVVDQIFQSIGGEGTRQEFLTFRADHSACTTRMSKFSEQGVVDEQLRVHGIDNLYVCSNSSFPNIGAVNPTLTLTALAIRLGNWLLKI